MKLKEIVSKIYTYIGKYQGSYFYVCNNSAFDTLPSGTDDDVGGSSCPPYWTNEREAKEWMCISSQLKYIYFTSQCYNAMKEWAEFEK